MMSNADVKTMVKKGMKHLRGQVDPRIRVVQEDQGVAGHLQFVALVYELGGHSIQLVRHQTEFSRQQAIQLSQVICVNQSKLLPSGHLLTCLGSLAIFPRPSYLLIFWFAALFGWLK